MNYAAHLLGWVALQSVWQTFAFALLLAAALYLLRGATATRRYRCAVAHLAATVGAVALSIIASHASLTLTPLQPRPGWLAGQTEPGGALLPVLAWVWLGGIAIAQFLVALRYLRLRRFLGSAQPAPRDVTAIVEEMSYALGLRRVPHVVSANTSSPMVAGGRSTVLVVPLGFGETYPRDEMRALLAHELAHILRRDYSKNLLQLLATSLLWWHPGAWMIYARIRHERECAADEHAVRLTGSAAPLARALYRLADLARPLEAVAIAASSSGLSGRISRIALAPEPPTRGRTPMFLAAALGALTLAAAAASATAPQSGDLTRAYAASAIAPPTLFTFHAHDPAGAFLLKMVRGRVVAIELEHTPVPADRVVQRGDAVRVIDAAGRDLLRVEVDPRGGLRWKARRAS